MVDVLGRDFYRQSALVVARELLGAVLLRRLPEGEVLAGRIVETEAYTGKDDLASHGRIKPTPRNLPMWGEAGHAYVYFTYGNHWMLNISAEPEGAPAAVLIRALEPLMGVPRMQSHRRGRGGYELTSGPAKLAQALAVTGADNRLDMTTPESGLWIESAERLADALVRTGARIGLGKRVAEPWFSMAWRWWEQGNLYVSVGSGKLP